MLSIFKQFRLVKNLLSDHKFNQKFSSFAAIMEKAIDE
jgi:hypothetical protein